MAAFGTQIAARVALALRAPVSVRHQWASPQHSSSKLVLCIRLAPLVGREHFVVITDLEGFFICSICLICVRHLLPGCVSAHRLSQIWKDFYLLHLLNLRETLAAWLGVVAHRIHRMH